MMKSRRYAQFAWGVLLYSLLVILWGAFVRATGSGAGCGKHWPLCNGVVVPRAAQVETLVEFSHRLSSGLSLLLVFGLVIWGFRLYGRGEPIRRSLLFALFFIIMEALIGAGLVLFGLTAENDSRARAVSMALHLVNTFLLMASLAYAAWLASGGAPMRLRGQGPLVAAWVVGLVSVLFVGMSGAITALGDTLFPAETFASGLTAELAPSAHFLLRLRVWHPFIAVAAGLYIILLTRFFLRLHTGAVDRLAQTVAVLVVVQLIAGAFNVALLAPVWMQMLHLLLACLVWLALYLLGVAAFAAVEPRSADRLPAHPPA